MASAEVDADVRVRAVATRSSLFETLVDEAMRTEEVQQGLRETPALEEQILRRRCLDERERMWDAIGVVAAEFHRAARRWKEAHRPAGIGPALRRILTSPGAQAVVALLGLASIDVSFLLADRTVAAFLPNVWYLVAALAMIALAAGLLVRYSSSSSMAFKAAAISATCGSFAAVFFSVQRITDEHALRAAGSFDDAKDMFWPTLAIGLTFIAPLAITGLRRRHSASSLLPLFLVVELAGMLILLKLLDGTGSVAVEFGWPDLVWFTFGVVVLAFDVVLAAFGFSLLTLGQIDRLYLAAQAAARAALVNGEILPFLRTQIGSYVDDFRTTVDINNAPGISQVFDPLYRVSTKAEKDVSRLMSNMPGGSIGLAGSRGPGKTTLMESYKDGESGDRPVSVLVAAPVEYTSREFLLHLYAKVCDAILGEDAALRVRENSLSELRTASGTLLRLLSGFVLTLCGGLLFIFPGAAAQLSVVRFWAIVMVSAGVFLAFSTFLWLIRQGAGSRDHSRTLWPLEKKARVHLEQIMFQQTFTATATGTIKIPAGIEGALSRARGLTRQPMGLPEIVDSLKGFLADIAKARGSVMVCIDELDKMKSEVVAEQFLNEIKGIFGIPGCYFLVSVSEEAMSTFERRGLPFRDVFDSTFDEVVWFESLTADEAMTMIMRRVILPIPFKLLCFALSGGLPRDLIRVVRALLDVQRKELVDLGEVAARLVDEGSNLIGVTDDVVALLAERKNLSGLPAEIDRISAGLDRKPPVGLSDLVERTITAGEDDFPAELADVVVRLVADDVRRKTRAVTVAARRLDAEPELSAFLLFCAGVMNEPIDANSLRLFVCRVVPRHSSAFGDAKKVLFRLIGELCCFYYYALTVVEFFAAAGDDARWVSSWRSDDRGLDGLTRARQAFAAGSQVAWQGISRFRRSWGMDEVEFPERILKEVAALPVAGGSDSATPGGGKSNPR